MDDLCQVTTINTRELHMIAVWTQSVEAELR